MPSIRNSRYTRAALGVCGAAVLASLTGCAAAAPPDIEATASLDTTTMQVTMPVDEYGMTPQDVDVVMAANEVLIDRCMRKAGFSNPYASPDYEPSPPFPNWRYGVWNAQFVAQYGLGDDITFDPAEEKLNADPDAFAKYLVCSNSESLTMLDAMQVYEGAPPSALVLASNESQQKAMDSQEGKEIVAEWRSCVEADGVTTVGGDSPLSVNLTTAATDETKYRQLTLAATCSDDLKTAKQLFDIEAKFQAEYIQSRQAEFQAIEKKRDKILGEARAILAEQ